MKADMATKSRKNKMAQEHYAKQTLYGTVVTDACVGSMLDI